MSDFREKFDKACGMLDVGNVATYFKRVNILDTATTLHESEIATLKAERDEALRKLDEMTEERNVKEESAQACAECGIEWAKRAEAAEARLEDVQPILAEVESTKAQVAVAMTRMGVLRRALTGARHVIANDCESFSTHRTLLAIIDDAISPASPSPREEGVTGEKPWYCEVMVGKTGYLHMKCGAVLPCPDHPATPEGEEKR